MFGGKNPNSIPEESKSRLNSRNVVCLPFGYPKI
jgi:hypothetical protein